MSDVAPPPSQPLLFVSAAISPGAVLRFLERRRRAAPGEAGAAGPITLLLSDAVGEERVRLLTSEGDAADAAAWLEAQAGPLSAALGSRVTLLAPAAPPAGGAAAAAGEWRFAVWERGELAERGGGAEAASPRRPGFWRRLVPGTRRPPLRPDRAWARRRGLPIGRLTAPVLDYVTVTQLDQRGLLVEDRPRLYRFPLNPPH